MTPRRCQTIHLRDLAIYLLLQIKAWEEAEMDKPMEIDEIRVDPSPFQLVERTSLHKVGGEESVFINCFLAVI